MDYLWIKSAHVAAVIVWIGGILMESIAIRACLQASAGGRKTSPIVLASIRQWDARVTSPAMLIAWGAGVTLAVTGNWFGDRWLTAKLALVVLLSALHGMLVGTLRRFVRDGEYPASAFLSNVPYLVVGIIAAVAVLVVVKP